MAAEYIHHVPGCRWSGYPNYGCCMPRMRPRPLPSDLVLWAGQFNFHELWHHADLETRRMMGTRKPDWALLTSRLPVEFMQW